MLSVSKQFYKTDNKCTTFTFRDQSVCLFVSFAIDLVIWKCHYRTEDACRLWEIFGKKRTCSLVDRFCFGAMRVLGLTFCLVVFLSRYQFSSFCGILQPVIRDPSLHYVLLFVYIFSQVKLAFLTENRSSQDSWPNTSTRYETYRNEKRRPLQHNRNRRVSRSEPFSSGHVKEISV